MVSRDKWLVGALILATPFVVAARNPGFESGAFVGGSVGVSRNTDGSSPYTRYGDRNDWAGMIRAGYRWHVSDIDWGLEGGYVDLGKAVVHAKGVDSVHGSVGLRGWMLGSQIGFQFDPQWYMAMRIGWLGATVSSKMSGPTGSYRASDNNNGTYVGGLVGYNVTPAVGVGINYDYYRASNKNGLDTHVSMYGVFGEYRF